MVHLNKQNIPGIGMRIIKSAVGVWICFLIDILRGNAGIVFYSQLAVLWCMRDYVSETRRFAIQRSIGTVIGALYGLVLLLLYKLLPIDSSFGGIISYRLVVSAFIILVLYTTVLLKQKQASYFSCVVFLSIVVNHIQDSDPLIFVWNRFLDTMIGILVGVSVNCFRLLGRKQKNLLFLSGLDDTLLALDGSMSDYSRVELNRMIDSGANFTVSTMRTPASLMEALRGIHLKLPVIAMDGAALYNIRENRYEYVYVISAGHSVAIRSYFDKREIPYFANVIVDDVLLIYYQDSEWQDYNDVVEKMRKSPYRNYIKRPLPEDENVVYFMVIDKTERIERLYADMMQEEFCKNLKVITHPATECEGCSLLKIYNKNASKENMIDYLKSQLGIEKTVTFGTIEGKYTHLIRPGDFNRVVKWMKKEYE